MFTFTHINEAKDFLVDKLSSAQTLESGSDFSRSSKFIAPYPPEQQKEAALVAAAVVQELSDRGVKASLVNAYDVVLDILDDEGMWEMIVETEPDMSKPDFTQALKDAVDLEGAVLPRIYEQVKSDSSRVLIVSGMGACYPFLRTHRLLANIEPGVPVLLFFPGRHTVLADGSTSLDVLSTPTGKGGSHYQARNIFDL